MSEGFLASTPTDPLSSPSTLITYSSPTPPRPTSPPTLPPPPASTSPQGLHPPQQPSASSSTNASTSSLYRSKSKSRNNFGSVGSSSVDSTWTRADDTLGRKKVRTKPPFARLERDSPPSSPKALLPASSSATFPRSSPLQPEQQTYTRAHSPQNSSTYPFHSLKRQISPLELSHPNESLAPRPPKPTDAAEPRVVRPGDEDDDSDREPPPSPPEGRRHEWWVLNKGKEALTFRRKTVAFGVDDQSSYFPDNTSSFPNTATTTGTDSYPPSPCLQPVPSRRSHDQPNPSPGSNTPPNGLARPAKARRSSHFPSFHIAIPRLDLSAAYSAHQSKTPGWDQPYSAAPFLPVDPEADEAKRRTRLERIGRWIIYSYWTPLALRAINFGMTAGTMGVGIKIRQLEADLGKQGVTGSSPVVALIYTPITLLHVLAAVYLEYFGRPVGLWSLSSKLLFTSLDLLSISLWSSLLSLSLSDLLSTPLTCVSASARWWTDLPVADVDFAGDHNVCGWQIALVVTVAVGTIGFLVNFFASLGRVLAKVLGRR